MSDSTNDTYWLDGNTPAWEIEHGDIAHVYTLVHFVEEVARP